MKRILGQHFLLDPIILKRIISSAKLESEDIVVEIGPGKGHLTVLLAEVVKELIAIELDYQLCEELKKTLSQIQNVRVFCHDALIYPYQILPLFKVVANIPYYITTPLIFKLLSNRDKLLSATLTVQKEVAQRIVARPGGKDYGVLSLMLQYITRPEIAFFIPSGAFSPPPKVDSAVVHLEILKKPAVKVLNEKLLFKVIKTAFSQRRKTIANSLKPLSPEIKKILSSEGIDYRRRPETLSLKEFVEITDKLYHFHLTS